MSSASGTTACQKKEMQGRNGSDATLTNEEQTEKKRMSSLHDIFFIMTICLAQIFALAGLGQGLGETLFLGKD